MDKDKFQKYMVFLAIFGSVYLYIQAYKIYRTKETAGVSELAYIFILISSIVWLIYGMVVNDKVIKASAISAIIGSLLVLFLILKYRDEEPPEKIDFCENDRDPEDIIEAYNDNRKLIPWFFVMNDTCDVIPIK